MSDSILEVDEAEAGLAETRAEVMAFRANYQQCIQETDAARDPHYWDRRRRCRVMKIAVVGATGRRVAARRDGIDEVRSVRLEPDVWNHLAGTNGLGRVS